MTEAEIRVLRNWLREREHERNPPPLKAPRYPASQKEIQD